MNKLYDIQKLMPDKRPKLEVVSKRIEKTMDAYIITLMNHHNSTVSARRVIQSIENTRSNIQPYIFPAVTPATLEETKNRYFSKDYLGHAEYTYPTKEERFDIRTGLKLKPYPTKDIRKRISCFMSHYSLWVKCYNSGQTIMILEQDSLFTRGFHYDKIKERFKKGTVLGLNDPRGATRKSGNFHQKLVNTYDERNAKLKNKSYVEVMLTPWIDDQSIPQGIAGNSAYIIKPEGAAKLISLTAENGIWPNDAIMCRQLMPQDLYVCYPYFTKVQGTESTTSL